MLEDKKVETDFNELENRVYKLLEDKKIMVLATSYKDKVTARSMSCIVYNKRIYFQTDCNFEKFHQIKHNNNVALCADNIQITGKAYIKSNTMSEECKFFADKYSVIHSGSFKAYSHKKETIVIEVIPQNVTLWEYDNGQPYREFLDLVSRKSSKEIYSID